MLSPCLSKDYCDSEASAKAWHPALHLPGPQPDRSPAMTSAGAFQPLSLMENRSNPYGIEYVIDEFYVRTNAVCQEQFAQAKDPQAVLFVYRAHSLEPSHVRKKVLRCSFGLAV